MEKIIIVGTSTTAKHAFDFINSYNLYEVIGFALNREYKTDDIFCGLPVFDLETLKEDVKDVEFSVFIALLWNRLNADRKNIYNYVKSQGHKMVNLISPHAVIRGELRGDNCWIHDFVIIQNDAVLGSNIMIMAYSLIGANTNVASHCFFGARSTLGGGSSVGEQTFVGINSTIFDGTCVGKKCIVGACTAVKRNMSDFSVSKTSAETANINEYREDEMEEKLMFSKNIR